MTIQIDAQALADALGAHAKTDIKAVESTISAVITRADGTVENIGVIAYWHANPLKRWWFNFTRNFLKG